MKFARNANRTAAIFNISSVNMDQLIVFLMYFASADDVHIKYALRWQPLACENSRPSSLPARVARNATRAGSEEGRLFSQANNRRLACGVGLSSTSQASRWSIPAGVDYDSAINVHMCRNGVPGRGGAYVPFCTKLGGKGQPIFISAKIYRWQTYRRESLKFLSLKKLSRRVSIAQSFVINQQVNS